MSRILIGTVPVIGHIAPFLPLARALVARGHEVRWYSGSKYRARIEATGARFVASVHMRDFDDAALEAEHPQRARLRGLAQLRFDMKHVFIDRAPGQLADIREIARGFAPDVIVIDPGMLGALLHAEQSGAGLDLKTATPSPAAVRHAVRTVLHDPKYRAHAAALAAEYARHDAVARALELIEDAAGAHSAPAQSLRLSA